MSSFANDFANLIFVLFALGGLCLAVREARRVLPAARRRRGSAGRPPRCPRSLPPEAWARIATGGSVRWK